MQTLFETDKLDQEILQQTWERCETEITHLTIKLDQFKQQDCEKKFNISVLEYVCGRCSSSLEKPYQVIP